MRWLNPFVLAAILQTSLHAEPEPIVVPPRVYADFELSEYKTPSAARTTRMVPVAESASVPVQPAYFGLQFEQSGGRWRVAQVDSQSPAAKAGFQKDDVLKSWDGKDISAPAEFRKLLKSRRPGDGSTIAFERAGKVQETNIVLGATSAPLTGADNSQRAILGIQTAPAENGMKITSITPGSPAEKAEFKIGDIITSLGGRKTLELDRLTESLADKKPGDRVSIELTRDGKEIVKQATLIAANDESRRNRNWDARTATLFRKPGYRLAVILIAYPDRALNEKITPKAWSDSLFSKEVYTDKNVTGQKVFGSLRDYYWEQSCGRLDVTGKVFEPIEVGKKRQDYINTTSRSALLNEAVDVLRERDGKDVLKDFDGVCFIYAGETATTQRGALYWPHRGTFTHKSERWNYFICPEGGAKMGNISTICHEFGHLLGLPDLYAKPEVPESEGLGAWCAMSNQVRSGRPQHFCAWSKEQLGWITPVVIDPAVPQKLILAPIEGTTGECFKVLIHPDGSEYLLLENRKKTGFDAELPGEGLLIWRVVEKRPILEESHGVAGPRGPGSFPTSVPFPSKANHSFTPYTTPSSKSLKGDGKEVYITNIRRLPDGKIAFQIGYEYW